MLLAGGPVRARHRGGQGRTKAGHAGEPRESGAQPLAVRRVAPVHEQGQPHQVPGQPGGDDDRAQVVAGLGAPAREGLFLPDALPLAGQHVPPDVARIPRQAGAGPGQITRFIVKNLPGGELRQPLRRGRQPVQQRDLTARVEPELAGQPGTQAGDLHAMPGGSAGFRGDGEGDGITAERGRQAAGQHRGDRLGLAGLLVGEEDLQARAPVVIDRALAVEAENLRPRAEQRGRVRHPREIPRKERTHDRDVELASKLQTGNVGTGNVGRSHPGDPRPSAPRSRLPGREGCQAR